MRIRPKKFLRFHEKVFNVSYIVDRDVFCWTMVSKLTFAIPRQQWLGKRATVLRYTYIACIVYMYVDRKLAMCSTFCSVEWRTKWIARFLPILPMTLLLPSAV
jgi:hypothetical protein